MKYDNNVLERVDGRFHEELLFRMRLGNQDDVRFASCAYNPIWDEIYLNIPTYGQSTYHGYTRPVRGQVYVIAPSRAYATKFEYMAHAEVPRDPKSFTKLYHLNSLGELRSDEVFPAGTSPALVSIEAPTETEYDHAFDSADALAPVTITILFRSKSYSGGDETIIKRVRKVLVNWFSTGDRTVRITSIPRANEDDRIDNVGLDTEFTFQSAPAIQRNTLHLTPQTVPSGDEWDD